MISILAFLLPITLYLGIPSAMWNFDGVACAAALELGQPSYLFHANHLLYGLFGFLFWKGLGAPLGIVRALPALQLYTSLLSAAGLLGLYRIFASILQKKLTALGLTLCLAVTAAFWVWSVEVQVYPLGFLALAWATYLLFRPASTPRKYIWTGVLHGAAVLGHQMHFLWVIPAIYWMRQGANDHRRQLGPYLGTLAAVVLIPYMSVLAFVIAPGRDLQHILIWLKGSAGLTPDRRWAWHFAGWGGPWVWLKSTLPALWGSFWPYGHTVVGPWIWGATMISGAIVLYLLIRAFRSGDALTRFSLVWLGVYGLFLSTWEPATLCYRMTDVIPLGILMAVGLKSLKGANGIILVSLLLASTVSVNLATRIGPMRRPEENSLYQETLALSKMTSPDTLYISEGGSPWIYLLYFTGRTAWNRHSLDPQRLENEITQQKKHRPVIIQRESSWEPVR